MLLYERGVVPVLVASFLSGVSATLTQWALQRRKRNSYFYSLELSAPSGMKLSPPSLSGTSTRSSSRSSA